eukprot:CAMPEP_0201474972 /NCGR_PEP_ID=MMETSP0151_2-20130828/462_1 /ASSEMBLY_ACC=CAM_ASM_000257 /TAXON_ID=200890 /ORGANISM="Paramoeba atlantica, Strain 621/1 / CCAP 1560/9" /LENGTH=121 /DNA_ID=CAMNT_0047854943 /DNA_START=103 /DNA_END=468 /DNA_ORIENTATION=-
MAEEYDYQAIEAQTHDCIGQGNFPKALEVLLGNPPYYSDQGTKDSHADLFMEVVSRVKESDIKKIVEGMNPDQLDVLMKYVYRGMERKPGSSQALLKYHETIRDKAGQGPIVRALTEYPFV